MAKYIDAEALKSILDAKSDMATGTPKICFASVVKMIDKLPAADVAEVKRGVWIPQVILGGKAWDCSECKTLGSPQWKWCPVCGAKMKG